MKFTKMHGAGNDYIYVDCTQSVIDNPSQVAIDLSDRHFGIGSDGLILIKKSDKADFFPTGNISPTNAAECYNTTDDAVGNRPPHAPPPAQRTPELYATGCHNKPIPDSPAHAVPASLHLATPNRRLHTHISLPSAHDRDSPANS